MKTILHQVNGEELTVNEAAAKYKIKRCTLDNRIHRKGMTLEQAVNAGKPMTPQQAAAKSKLTRNSKLRFIV